MAKVAVVSTDGVVINEHFGKAREFFIYEVQENGEYQLIEQRASIAGCSGGGGGHQQRAAELLADVEVVLAAQIGPGAEQQLRNYGVIALTVASSIDKALQAYGKRGRFIRNSVLRSAGAGCSGSGGSCRSGCCR
ncbi:dinitrogenase iron-molybdenum cofactor biosynthesis protein|uniref:Predicted Fe-Mo cluster-binding protein, NifX family n=1 Tax=Dendrosporobacter quercicolus TaxID=146817 RepID=A0A1G9S4P5_9FIRM|nr:NifB/NifX family molybdenum-iron cluster-binding protein [Dendrosporobacter quercicolus]NSL49468.1 dinitrogenase iron-molybdenum cofactor biosynthesis protein [Dendrosporobacter quercicolus DSM 1736]SDM30372.1 Predicted Fe-Mo cluster-binding protein, NifX family [Dendrosporobacter quercicolus]